MSKKNSFANRATKDELIKCYELMLSIRRFEEQAGSLYNKGMIGGFCHLCIGQEAIPVAIAMLLEDDDTAITSYRDHGIMLATGSDPKVVMAELTGRAAGCSKGKGGSMHMFDVETGFYGGHGIVGAQTSIGTGLGFANKYRNNKGLCFVLLGDGAANQGQFFESMNMAKLWNLPVLYIIEDNKYGMGTSVNRASSITDFSKKGISFGIDGHLVNGMNVFDTYDIMSDLVAKIRKGHGPQLLHVETYRYRGHSMSDPATYRSKDEVSEVRQNNDALDILETIMMKRKVLTAEDLKAIDKKVRKHMQEVVEFSIGAPEPEESELWTDIYTI